MSNETIDELAKRIDIIDGKLANVEKAINDLTTLGSKLTQMAVVTTRSLDAINRDFDDAMRILEIIIQILGEGSEEAKQALATNGKVTFN